MKKALKTLALLLTLVFIATMNIFVFAAAPTYTLTLNNSGETAHEFQIYQIFTGDLSVNGSGQKVLSNIVWGDGITAGGKVHFGNAADTAETIITEADGKAFADELLSVGYVQNATTVTVAANSTETVTNLNAGYYLIKDKDNTQGIPNGAYTAYILEIIGDVTATTKLDIPSVEKKVKDINDTLESDISASPWQDSADHDVGDTVPFMITGSLPSNFSEYESYYYQITDEMSAGLTYNNDAKVYVVNDSVETEITSQVGIVSSADTAGTTIEITATDLKSLTGVTVNKDSKIVVYYTAQLNEHAVAGSAGNTNSAFLTYSNNPNAGHSGVLGITPKDKTVVFTYQFVFEKVDENGAPLENAGFTLYKKDSSGNWQTVKAISAGSDTQFTFFGLDDGDYKLVESEVPEGYNKFNDLEFTITAVHETDSQTPSLISINGVTTEGGTVILDGTQNAAVSLVYGELSTTVVNKPGSLLPTTGGIGTKIFYITGALLAIAAIVLLITKKRMKSEK